MMNSWLALPTINPENMLVKYYGQLSEQEIYIAGVRGAESTETRM